MFFTWHSKADLLIQSQLESFDSNAQKFYKNFNRSSFIKLAEEDSIFDESDLIDIESGNEADLQNEDDLLEQEFNSIEEDQSETNFDPNDFEKLEGESKTQEEEMMIEDEGDFNALDYEIISDRPGYEILTDEELEEEFEGSEGTEEDSLESEAEEDFEDENMEEEEEGESFEDLEDESMEEGDMEDYEEAPEDESQALEEEEEKQEPIMEEETSNEEDIKSNLENLPEDTEEEPVEEEFVHEEPLEEEPSQDESLEEDLFEEEESSEEAFEEDSPFEEDSSFEEEAPISEEEYEGISDSSSLNLITNIRYLIESNQIVIDASEIPTYEERVNEKNNQLILEILQAKLARNLSWPYIMRDFDTDFGLLKADQKDATTVRVIIQLKPSAPIPPVVLTEDGRIVIGEERLSKSSGSDPSLDISSEILPSKTLKDLYFGDIDFVGDPISFHVIDADVRQVLRFISEESGINMVIDEAVKGTVTLKLEDVPWDQALYTIFKVNSLGYLRDGNIITILPLKKIQEQTTQLKEISDRQRGLSPLETKIIPIMYGKASDIETKVKQFSTPAVQGLTKGGQIIVHEESNSLIIMDNMEAIQKIERLAKFLDYPSQQVMIESKIVEVSKSFARDFGLNWSLSGNLPVRISGNILEFLGSSFSNLSADWGVINKGRANTFSINGLPFIGSVNATLNLAENNGTARVLNTTKILVKSGKSATIDKNTPIQIRNSETQNVQGGLQEGNVTTTFQSQDVKLNSSVTPTVTSSGSISMNINITLSDPGPGGEGQPTVITRNANTEIISKSGQTVVLSGIYQKSENKSQNGTPLLRHIPFLGFLFDDSSFSTAESEMLMFVTPTLIEN